MARGLIYVYIGLIAGLDLAGPQAEDLTLQSRIREVVHDLGYPAQVGEVFLQKVQIWQQRCGVDLPQCTRGLDRTRSYSAELAIARSILRLVSENLAADGQTFELEEVLARGKANCLGSVQCFYVLAGSVGLSVIPIEVLQLQSPGSLPIGSAHISCMVRLSDRRLVMLNAVPGYGLSGPFYLEDLFKRDGVSWRLSSSENPLRLYRRIRPLDRSGLVAYIYNNRGVALVKAGLYDQAIDSYLKAIDLDANNANVYNNLGIAYRNKGLLQNAIDCYGKAISLYNEYAEVFNNRAVAYNTLGLSQQAILDCNQAIAICPRFSQAYNNRGNAHLRMGQYGLALADYCMAIRLDPRLAQAYTNRALVYNLMGKQALAQRDLATAVRLDPGLRPKVAVISRRLALDMAR